MKYNDISMSAEANKLSNIFETSLNIDPQFSYINLIQQDLSKDQKRSQLKVYSKIRRTVKSREKTRSKKSKENFGTSRSASRKKSKTNEKSQSKNLKINKKIGQKYFQNSKKQYKTIETKTNQIKPKQYKSTKAIPLKKLSFENIFKKQEAPGRKKKNKEQVHQKINKTSKTQKSKEVSKPRLKKSKSETLLDHIGVSQITKFPKFGVKQSKVMHQYFGLEDKLYSILQQKKGDKLKTDRTKLSKCKTHSSASSLSLKNLCKFKPTRPKK